MRLIRLLALTFSFVALLYLTGLRADRALTRPGAPATTHLVPSRVVSGHHAPGLANAGGLYRGHTAAYWAAFGRHRTRQLQDARRVLFSRPSVAEAIDLAAAAYGVDRATLWRKARCESHLNPRAHNPSDASGLFQFLLSTWRSTPFGRFSIWSPYANALAAGWMHKVGRGGEWVCQ